MRIFTLFFILMCQTALSTNTFVGNGGDSTDLLLNATLGQIHKVMTENMGSRFCVCKESDHPMCPALKSLSRRQAKYCHQTVTQTRSKLAKMIGSDRKIRFLWTEHALMLGERSHEAIANAADQKITLNRKRFIQMTSASRIALVTHELYHLIEKNRYKDEIEIGPFTGAEGGRELLNAIGASTAIRFSEMNLDEEYRHLISGSKLYETHWLGLHGSLDSYPSPYHPMAGHTGGGTSIDYDYQYHFKKWGLFIGYSKKQLMRPQGGISLKENIGILSAGMLRKIEFKSDNTTKYGQSHLLLKFGIGYAQSEYKISDSYLELTEKATHLVPLVELQYMFPLHNGFWFSAGLRFRFFDYKYKDLNVEASGLEVGLLPIGVNYGF